AVNLPTAVVRDDDSVDTVLDGTTGIVRVQDSFQKNREPRRLAQERDLIPGQRRPREDVEEESNCGPRAPGPQVLPGRARVCAGQPDKRTERGQGDGTTVGLHWLCLVEQPLEDWVADVLCDPLPEQKRQGGKVEIA